MLRWRLSLGAVLIAALAGLCWLDLRAGIAGTWLYPLALVFSLLAAGEVLWLLSARDLRPLPWLVVGGSFLVAAVNGLPQFWPHYPADCPLGRWGWPLATLGACLLVGFVGELRRYQQPGQSIVRLALASFGVTYVGLLFSFVLQLRFLDSGSPPGNSPTGIIALVSLIAVVKMCDTGAYTVGRLIGRHKMAPTVSPGKTWEGAAGGIALACLGAWIVLELWAPWLRGNVPADEQHSAPAWGWLAYGAIVGAAGMLGDLAESLLKRDMGRKDSSRWLPGFGGVLDVLDSILFAAPVAYLCWIAGLVR